MSLTKYSGSIADCEVQATTAGRLFPANPPALHGTNPAQVPEKSQIEGNEQGERKGGDARVHHPALEQWIGGGPHLRGGNQCWSFCASVIVAVPETVAQVPELSYLSLFPTKAKV